MTTLYERLGGADGIANISNDIVDLHMNNKRISSRFIDSDVNTLKNGVATFFAMGTGGPSEYKGKDMLATHKGMNIDLEEFIAVLDDALTALEKNNIGGREKEEVLYILYSMKSDVVFV